MGRQSIYLGKSIEITFCPLLIGDPIYDRLHQPGPGKPCAGIPRLVLQPRVSAVAKNCPWKPHGSSWTNVSSRKVRRSQPYAEFVVLANSRMIVDMPHVVPCDGKDPPCLRATPLRCPTVCLAISAHPSLGHRMNNPLFMFRQCSTISESAEKRSTAAADSGLVFNARISDIGSRQPVRDHA